MRRHQRHDDSNQKRYFEVVCTCPVYEAGFFINNRLFRALNKHRRIRAPQMVLQLVAECHLPDNCEHAQGGVAQDDVNVGHPLIGSHRVSLGKSVRSVEFYKCIGKCMVK